jgi:group I intron endonuclease
VGKKHHNFAGWVVKSGIYKISSPSGGFYIGSAVNFSGRRRQHFHLLRFGCHHNIGLQRACKKYGIDALKFEPIIICRREDLIFFEQRAIDVLKPKYNGCFTAGSQLGRKHSEETKAKISANRKGKGLHPPEWRRAASERLKGHPRWGPAVLSEETRKKISAAFKGKKQKHSFEVRATDAQKMEIVRDYLGGLSQPKLERKWKISHRTVRRILVAAGVVVHPSGFTIKKASRFG